MGDMPQRRGSSGDGESVGMKRIKEVNEAALKLQNSPYSLCICHFPARLSGLRYFCIAATKTSLQKKKCDLTLAVANLLQA